MSRNYKSGPTKSTGGFEVGAVGTNTTAIDSDGNLYQAGTQVTSSASELNLLDGGPASVTLESETGGSGTCAVQLSFQDAAGVTMAVPHAGTFYISEVDTGLTRDPADTSVAVLTNGAITELDAAHKVFAYTTDAAGLLGMTITAAADSYWLVFIKPNGLLMITGPCICDA